MDVYGNAPTAEVGAYFRNTVWWWHPLWAYCREVYAPCREVAGHVNEGDGLDAEHAAELGTTLRRQLAAGHTAAYAAIRQAEIDAMPNTPCAICEATGRQLVMAGSVTTWIDCYECEGTGSAKPWAASYCFDAENVRAFAEFCAASGGFRIW
jgi:hypothetical protein